ncbi:MAG TPA: hypothetical protein VFZ58_01475 [Candidatus Saccharimonadales bacterium]
MLNVQVLNWSFSGVVGISLLLLLMNIVWTGKKEPGSAVDKISFILRTKYRQLIAFFTLSFALMVLWFDNFFTPINIEAKDELASILLVLTAGIVFWNMKETYDLKTIQQKQEATQQKQFDFENRPYLRIAWSERGGILHITNQGRGLARDVFIEAVSLDSSNPGLVFKPRGRSIIAPGEVAVVTDAEIQSEAGLAEINTYGDYLTSLKQIMDTRLKEGAIEKVQLSYIDLNDEIYEAFFKPREDVDGRFIIDSRRKKAPNL